MKVFVTGATSGLGRNAAQWLLEHGHEVHATGRNSQAGEELTALGAQFTALDLTQASSKTLAKLVKNADWVWHCAALSSPWGKADDFYLSNTLVTQNLAQVCGQMQLKRFVHISTPSIYFDFQNRYDIHEEFFVSEFANSYAFTKFEAEQAIIASQKAFPHTQYIMLRPRGIFGPHDRVILPRVLQQVTSGNGLLKLPQGGSALLDLTFVHNVVHAMFLASTKNDLPPAAAYNITNQEPRKLAYVLTRLFKDELQMDFRIKALPYPLLYGVASVMEAISLVTQKEPMLTRYSVGALNFDMTLNSGKARSELGYEPLYSLEDGIQQTAQWLKSQSPKQAQDKETSHG